MRRWWLATAFLALSACDQRAPPLVAYRHPRDALASVLPLDVLGIYPCASRQKESGIEVVVGVPVDQCFKMLPAKRFRGIWLDEFEGSIFIDGARDVETTKAELRRSLAAPVAHREWLGWNDADRDALFPRSSNARLVAVDFIGRRTAYPGRYGHMGMSSSEVVVDRVISVRPIYQAHTP
jgi:hypothetical protein